MISPAATAHADQLAASLRDARCCDALDPCESCAAARAVVQTVRHVAAIPMQRTSSAHP